MLCRAVNRLCGASPARDFEVGGFGDVIKIHSRLSDPITENGNSAERPACAEHGCLLCKKTRVRPHGASIVLPTVKK